MRNVSILLAGALAMATTAPALARPAPHVAAALADSGRPEADKARDEARRPAQMLAFAGIRPGMKVGELLPGGGYFTRIFAKAVGPRGKVYAWTPVGQRYVDRFAPLAAAHPNATLVQSDAFSAPEALDVVWTSQNYHDLHLPGRDAMAVNAAIFKALKPGGRYIVVDHRARAGSGIQDIGTLHRIDEARVISEVLKAGFVLEDEDMSLRRMDDDHSRRAGELKDLSDQMVLKFRKPL